MAENAGRERALLGGIIGSRAKLSTDNIRKLADFRGRVELSWDTISPMRQRSDISARIAEALAKVDEDYFRVYGQNRDGILASAANGEYKISGSEYVAQATTAINSILRLADAIGEAADQEAASVATRSSFDLFASTGILAASVALALVSFWIAFSRILRPLSSLTGAMGKLADGDFAVVLPGLDRKDEVGEMAQAVEMRSRPRRRRAKKPKTRCGRTSLQPNSARRIC